MNLDMAAAGWKPTEAERLLADTGWLPEPLRTTDSGGSGDTESKTSTDALPAFLVDAEEGNPEDPTDPEEPSHAVAAECIPAGRNSRPASSKLRSPALAPGFFRSAAADSE
jgi:hypothetical protein